MIDSLPRREREIFEILCSAGEATAADVRRAMKDSPSHSAVRTMLSRLEAKGMVRHRNERNTYIYKPAVQTAKVRESALRQIARIFFDGSTANAATALLGLTKNMSGQELNALQRAVDKVKATK